VKKLAELEAKQAKVLSHHLSAVRVQLGSLCAACGGVQSEAESKLERSLRAELAVIGNSNPSTQHAMSQPAATLPLRPCCIHLCRCVSLCCIRAEGARMIMPPKNWHDTDGENTTSFLALSVCTASTGR
jgi:hypothetical protein